MYLDALKDRFQALNIARPDELRPCSEAEVRALEQTIGGALPAAYREFLLWMGHGAGPFMRGTDCFYGDLPQLREWAEELLAENNFSEPLPAGAFVFCMHQGYQFMFLQLAQGDDPPVHYYNETQHPTTFSVLSPSFSAFLSREIEGHAQLMAESQARRGG